MKINNNKLIKDIESSYARDHLFKFAVGTLICPNNSGTFKKNGMMVVVDHLILDGYPNNYLGNSVGNFYLLYSQFEQRVVEIKCWVVNSFYSSVDSSPL